MYQELQRKKNDLQLKKPYNLNTAVALRELDQLDHICNALMLNGAEYSREEIRGAVKTLSEKGLIYLNVHNNYIQLKAASGAEVPALISDCVEKRRRSVRIVDILNSFNTEKFIYPTSYNVKNKMTRYFRFAFISEKDFFERKN